MYSHRGPSKHPKLVSSSTLAAVAVSVVGCVAPSPPPLPVPPPPATPQAPATVGPKATGTATDATSAAPDSRCLAAPPPDGIYSTCSGAGCQDLRRVAILGGCIGVAAEGALQRRISVSSPDAFEVQRVTFIGGCDRGFGDRYRVSGDTLTVATGKFGCGASSQAPRTTRLKRVGRVPVELGAGLSDSRRAVRAAAVERSSQLAADSQCGARAALLDAKEVGRDPTLALRVIELARHRCLAPALERLIRLGALGTAAANGLAKVVDQADLGKALLRLLPHATARNESGIVGVLLQTEANPPLVQSLEALMTRSKRAKTTRMSMMALERLERREPHRAAFSRSTNAAATPLPAATLRRRNRQRSLRFFARATKAACPARAHLLSYERAFGALRVMGDADVIGSVLPLLEAKDCAVTPKLAFYLGARFAHRRQSSETLWRRTRELAIRVPKLQVPIREGLACGGTSCPSVGSCHHGARSHVSPERDKLLALLRLPMCS